MKHHRPRCLGRLAPVGATLAALVMLTPVGIAAGREPSAAAALPDDPTGAPIGQAPTPPMGWASWNAFGVDITEARVLASAQALIGTGLAK